MSNSKLTTDQGRFIESLASLLIPWGMTNTSARLYGYLLLQNEPASLDDIVRDLEISKSNACTAANALEQQQNARRVRERGSKRVLYALGYLSAEALQTALFTHTAYTGEHLLEAETMKDKLLSSINRAISETQL